jgi:hypothetical protein
MTTDPLPSFEEHRPLLLGIAYRMLGTVMDAQDLVQETFLRWQKIPPGEILSPRAWLTTVVTRLCINHLKLALACLADHVVLLSDGGGKARALRRPIHGADPIARVLIGAARKFGSATAKNFLAFMNGFPGLVTFENERAVRVMAFIVEAGGHISQIFVITNPDKLRQLSRPD